MEILICISGMPYAKQTVVFGNLIASLGESYVTLLTVVDDEEEIEPAEATLREARKLLDVSEMTVKVRQGDPVHEIVRESRKGDYDFVIIGSRIAKGVFGLVFGSISGKVVQQASSSVLVVKEDRPQIRRILICTGGRQISRSVVTTGARLAQAAGAKVKLLHVVDRLPAMYAGLDTMEETLPELLQTNTPIAQHLRWTAEVLAHHEVQAELALHRGIAVDEILREASEMECDLLVIGAQVEQTTWLNELLVSTVTPQIVDRAPCSVLVVRSRTRRQP